MKKLSEILTDIQCDLAKAEVQEMAVKGAEDATGYQVQQAELLHSILENQKALATYVSNHELLVKRAGHFPRRG